MPRIPALGTADAPAASRPLLDAVEHKLGKVPNLLKTFAHSPAALRMYLAQGESLAGGALSAALREQIALATAGANGCDYCASAHTLLGRGAGLDADEMRRNLRGESRDATIQAVLSLVVSVLDKRGHVGDEALDAVRSAGYGDADIVEIVANVVANIFTNYFNHVADTAIDLPFVSAAEPVAA